MKPKVFIDGQSGTTGLQIAQRLRSRVDIELLSIGEEVRKDASARKEKLNSADVVILCLPDDAAREAVALIENPSVRVIDASTAHRTAPGWDYGFPELSASHRAAIATSRRVANPGCHPTGFLSLVYPLVTLGILQRDYPLTCFSLTGYSGGGKKMIGQYEAEDKTADLFAPRIYGLNQSHKHLPEMIAIAGLTRSPIFCPVVDDYYRGMATSITLYGELMAVPMTTARLRETLAEYYADQRFVTVAPVATSGMLEANYHEGTNNLTVTVSGDEDRMVVTARFDNLGKGASGAAVQNMNIMLSLPEDAGLSDDPADSPMK